MGFNVDVHSSETGDNRDCYHFIDRMFYNFVVSADLYGDESILIRSGDYYGLDLYPLTKLVYTWDEPTKEYIEENTQDTHFLFDLVSTFQNKIRNDKSVCSKINYTSYEAPYELSEEEVDEMIAEAGKEKTELFLQLMNRKKEEMVKNPNPWKSYFENGTIINDLDDLIKCIACYKKKGIATIFLTAG